MQQTTDNVSSLEALRKFSRENIHTISLKIKGGTPCTQNGICGHSWLYKSKNISINNDVKIHQLVFFIETRCQMQIIK